MDEERQEMTLEDALRTKAADLIDILGDQIQPGTKEYSAVVDDLCKISKVIIQSEESLAGSNDAWNRLNAEKEKAEKELELKNAQFEKELAIKKAQLELEIKAQEDEAKEKQKELTDQKIVKIISFGIDAAGILIPIMFYNAWMNRGFKFEETGTFTSTTFRGLFGKFKPTRVD